METGLQRVARFVAEETRRTLDETLKKDGLRGAVPEAHWESLKRNLEQDLCLHMAPEDKREADAAFLAMTDEELLALVRGELRPLILKCLAPLRPS